MQEKPIYLNLLTFAFPITAIISILHRISGVALFLFLPLFLGMLQDALFFGSDFVKTTIPNWIIWIALTTLVYHLFAGLRHLCMDAGWGEKRRTAVRTSYIVLILTAIFSAWIGIKLC